MGSVETKRKVLKGIATKPFSLHYMWSSGGQTKEEAEFIDGSVELHHEAICVKVSMLCTLYVTDFAIRIMQATMFESDSLGKAYDAKSLTIELMEQIPSGGQVRML